MTLLPPRPVLALCRVVARFDVRGGPHILAVLVVLSGIGLVAAGLALSEAAGFFPRPEPVDPDVPPPPPDTRPEPGAAGLFLVAASYWLLLVFAPVAFYHALVAALEDAIDAATSWVLYAQDAADA